MKRLLLLLGIVILFSECNDSPPAATEKIEGTWRLVAYEVIENGVSSWTKAQPSNIHVRHDGLILDDQGFLPCCPPETLIINGTTFKIKPKIKVFRARNCELSSCAPCPTLKIQHTDNEIITTNCSGYGMKYVRQ